MADQDMQGFLTTSHQVIGYSSAVLLACSVQLQGRLQL
jgi:hypothetical protein